jgi:hypothetical protein
MKLYILFKDVESLLYEDVKFEDAKADAQKLLMEWKETLDMTKDPIWLGVNEGGEIRCLFEIETSESGIEELDGFLMSMSRNMGKNLGTRISVLDFSSSSDCCYQEYDDGEYGSGVISSGDESGVYVNHAEITRKEWGIKL